MKVERPYAFGSVSVPSTAVAERELAPIEPWHIVGTAGEPAFSSLFKARAGEPLGFRKIPSGLVELKGACDSVGATSYGQLFVLPVGYRPDRQLQFWAYYFRSAVSQHDLCIMNVMPDGQVFSWGATQASLGLDLTNVRFQLRIQR